jgi:hypothetical protein
LCLFSLLDEYTLHVCTAFMIEKTWSCDFSMD